MVMWSEPFYWVVLATVKPLLQIEFKEFVAVCVLTVELAKLARMHNDSNAISLGQRMNSSRSTHRDSGSFWFGTPFEGGRHIPHY